MASEKGCRNKLPRSLPPEPSPNLFGAILGRIEAEKRRAARRRLMVFSFAGAISGIGLIPAYQFFRAEISASGFIQFLSLLFSDPEVAFLYWQDFSLSFLELLPVAGLAAILGSVLAFLGSLRLAVREMKNAFTVAQTA